MNSKRALGSLFAGLAVACAGKSLTVDDEPSSASTESNSSANSSGGSSPGGSGGTDPTTGSGGTVATSGGSGGTDATSGGSGGTDATSGGSGGTDPTTGSGGSSTTQGAGGTDPTTGSGGSTTSGGPPALPCDVLEADGHPCVAAHSTVRALRSGYNGPLYQLCIAAEGPGTAFCPGEVLDISTISGGYADIAAHDEFCEDNGCTITTIYDQSGQGNHLEPSPPSSVNPNAGHPVRASSLPVTIGGHEGYGILIRPGDGYRAGCDGCTTPIGQGIPVGDEPQTIYMVASQHDLIDGCCFDYGNAETTTEPGGNGTMEAVYLGQGVIWGTGSGEGPWVMADLENGLYAGWENNQDHDISTNTSLMHDFVTAVLVGDTAEKNDSWGRFALYGGDAQSGELKTMWDGVRPMKPGYVPMQKQGSIILGIGGDNSAGGGGRFYEGVIATGAASQATLDALQAAIVAAKYE